MSLFKHLITLSLIIAASAAGAYADNNYVYHDMSDMPLYGTLAPDASEKYTRLPDSLKSKIRPDLWELGQHSAGLAIRFRTASPNIVAKWHSRIKADMNHMTATGIRGLDVYTLDDKNNWTFMNSCRPEFYKHNSETLVMGGMEPKMREYLLYLSLYDGVDSLYIGTDSAYTVLPPAVDLPRKGKPVVMYGTSILHGGCATRPGMAHTNILERMLQREVVNLGFSGNGRLDAEIAEVIAGNDASIIVIDPLPNVSIERLDEAMPEFIRIIREKQPNTPIVLVETPLFPLSRFKKKDFDHLTNQNVHLNAIYKAFKDKGDKNIYIFGNKAILNGNTEATVDNYHFTDTGFQIFAEGMYPMLKKLLKKQGL